MSFRFFENDPEIVMRVMFVESNSIKNEGSYKEGKWFYKKNYSLNLGSIFLDTESYR